MILPTTAKKIQLALEKYLAITPEEGKWINAHAHIPEVSAFKSLLSILSRSVHGGELGLLVEAFNDVRKRIVEEHL